MHKNLIGRGKRVYLVFAEDDTKNGEPVDFELPARVIDVVAWYIREYRPHLVRAPTDALFPGEGNEPKSQEGLGAQIKETVFASPASRSIRISFAMQARRSFWTSGQANTRS